MLTTGLVDRAHVLTITVKALLLDADAHATTIIKTLL